MKEWSCLSQEMSVCNMRVSLPTASKHKGLTPSWGSEWRYTSVIYIFKDEVSRTEVKDKFISLFLRNTGKASTFAIRDEVYLQEFAWNQALLHAFGASHLLALCLLFPTCKKAKSIAFLQRTAMCITSLHCHPYYHGEAQLKFYHSPWLT